MTTVRFINDNLIIFPGLYESELYNSDTDYLLADALGASQGEEVIYDFDEFKKIAGKACVDSLNKELYSHNVIIDMRYVGINSPTYYNYTTDKVIIDIDYNFIALVKYCKHTKRKEFDKYLADNYTSCSGYTSFIKNSAGDFFANSWFNSHKNIAIQVMIEFYLINEVDLEAHLYNMYEVCQEWLCFNAELKQVS